MTAIRVIYHGEHPRDMCAPNDVYVRHSAHDGYYLATWDGAEEWPVGRATYASEAIAIRAARARFHRR